MKVSFELLNNTSPFYGIVYSLQSHRMLLPLLSLHNVPASWHGAIQSPKCTKANPSS